MENIFHTFTIKATAEKIFEGISTSEGLDKWWTKTSVEEPRPGGVYTLFFGPEYNWKARVTKYRPGKEFELQMTDAYPAWLDTRIGFLLTERDHSTRVDFYHTGWPENDEEYRFSSYCWAMYLRILKRYIEWGEEVPYEKRLSV